jgi:hypothetical protein
MNTNQEAIKKHWEMQPNACVHYFNNNQFTGLLLDATKWQFAKYYLTQLISSMTNFIIDTNSFDVCHDTLVIWAFESVFKDTLAKNDTLITFPSETNINFYYRQYVRFCVDRRDYLFVGFHTTDNLTSDGEKTYYRHQDSFRVDLDELEMLISSRIFRFEHYKWALADYQFFILYDIELKSMKFVYLECKRKM